MNCQITSFQNMCDMLYYRQKLGKNWRFLQENRCCAKKTPQNRRFWCARIWVTWLWKALDAKRLTTGQLQAFPWKLWGMTVQASYVGIRWHQNWAHMSSQHFFMSVHENWRKCVFFCKTLPADNFQRENCLGPVTTESLCTQDSENIVGLGDWTFVSKL